MKFFILLLIFSPSLSHAGLFKIINRNYGTATAYQAEVDQVFNLLEETVNTLLPAADNASFVTSMANNGSMSGAANMGNYGSPFDLFEAGLHGGVSVQSANSAQTDKVTLNNVGGVGAQATLRLGMRGDKFGDSWLGFDLKKTWFYVGLLTYDYSQDVTNFRFGAATFYAQHRFLEPSGVWWDSLKWNGLNVGVGLRYQSLQVEIVQNAQKEIKQVVDSMPGTPEFTANYNGTMTAGADIKALALPLEVSTSARVLYVMTIFMGLGVDITLGKAKSIANLTGPVNITESTNTYGTFSGDATLDIGDEGSPRTFGGRFFSGVQFEAGVASFSITTTRSIPEKDTSINAGFRLYW